MQQVINNLLYDTEKSILIGYYDENGYYEATGDPRHWIYELYKTKNNNFFQIRKCQNFETKTGLFKSKMILTNWMIFLEPLSLGKAINLFEKLTYKNKSYEETFDFEIKEA